MVFFFNIDQHFYTPNFFPLTSLPAIGRLRKFGAFIKINIFKSVITSTLIPKNFERQIYMIEYFTPYQLLAENEIDNLSQNRY